MVFNYNIRFVRLNVVMCVFLLEDLKRFGFFVGCKITNADKKTTLQIRQMAKQIGQNPRKPPINKWFGKFVKRRGKKWMVN